jgi:hypothetical protein
MGNMKFPHASGNSTSIAAPSNNPASDIVVKLPSSLGSANQFLKNGSTPGELEFGTTGICTNNLVMNGHMIVAQRGTSFNGGDGYAVDRFKLEVNSNDENATISQANVSSSDAPYQLGLKKCLKVENGNQTSGAGLGDRVQVQYHIEAQDMGLNSGWNYTSASSFITLSFWCKSSVAQNFYGALETADGTAQNYPFETGSLSANTWTKITKTIPGNSNLQFDNNANLGLKISWHMWKAGNHTASGVALNTWAAYASGTETPDQTSTWYLTNDSTFELTGVQLELGQVANDFKFESYADTLFKCERYYYQDLKIDHRVADGQIACNVNSGAYLLPVGGMHPRQMRSSPTLTLSNFTYYGCAYNSSNTNDRNWGMRVTVDNTSQFRITTGEAKFDSEF